MCVIKYRLERASGDGQIILYPCDQTTLYKRGGGRCGQGVARCRGASRRRRRPCTLVKVIGRDAHARRVSVTLDQRYTRLHRRSARAPAAAACHSCIRTRVLFPLVRVYYYFVIY